MKMKQMEESKWKWKDEDETNELTKWIKKLKKWDDIDKHISWSP